MGNAWFRLYHEWDSDPKVQSMPEHMQRRLVMLFCSKCKGETLQDSERAFHWRISDSELAATKALFMEKGFIDGDWNLINWNRRQFLSDSSTERVRKHRQAMKQDETLHETDVKQGVTPPDTETDTETEQKQRKTKATAGAKAPLFVLPAWIDRKAWDGYEEMRRKKRCALTESARELCVRKLDSLKRAGHDPTAVLNQSTMNGWQGLFEVKNGGMNASKPSKTEQIRESSLNALAILERMDSAENCGFDDGQTGRTDRRLLEGTHGPPVA